MKSGGGKRHTETHEICGFAAQSAFVFVTNYWNSMIAVTVCTQAYCLASPHKINKLVALHSAQIPLNICTNQEGFKNGL